MSSTAAAPTRPGSLISLVAFYRLLIRMQITVPRLLGIGGLGALAVLIGLFARFDDNSSQAAADAVSSYGLAILVPLAALWLGTSAIGDLVEDRLLVYLWLKPVPRWQLPAAAILAVVSVVVPLTAVPITVSAFIAGAGDVAWAALLAASLATLAYAGLFVAAGALAPASDLVGARLHPDLGERGRLHSRGIGSLHGRRLGILGSGPRLRHRRAARRGVHPGRARRPACTSDRRLAPRDLALSHRRYRLTSAQDPESLAGIPVARKSPEDVCRLRAPRPCRERLCNVQVVTYVRVPSRPQYWPFRFSVGSSVLLRERRARSRRAGRSSP
jgi:hypothetical protein